MITVTVIATRGSAPREVGAHMVVSATGFTGTIGGGALEWEALRLARQMLATGEMLREVTWPLGAALGQCCGGAVTLRLEAGAAPEDGPRERVYIWGGGHVGRALANVLAPLGRFRVHVLDTLPDRLPQPLAPEVELLVVPDPAGVAAQLGTAGHHVIVTHSHDLDLALCDALLRRPADSIGLIGSATKWARFARRLSAMGHGPEALARISCPIGDKSLGKAPQAIAIGVASGLISAARAAGETAAGDEGA